MTFKTDHHLLLLS